MGVLLRIRTGEASTLIVNATGVGEGRVVTVLPFKPEEEDVWVSWSSREPRSRSADGVQGPWCHARVVGVVDLQVAYPAYAELLSISSEESFRSWMVLCIGDGRPGPGGTLRHFDEPESTFGCVALPLAMGDGLKIKGSPFPQLLNDKFESTHQAYVSCSVPPMYLIDASLAVGGLEGAPLISEHGETVGFLGDAVQGTAGSRFLIGWDLSVVNDAGFGTVAARKRSSASSPDSHLARCLSRLVSVHVGDTFGTGFLIRSHGDDAVVCTNAHVIGDPSESPVYVRCVDGKVFPALRWASFDGIVDLAFLRVPYMQAMSSWPAGPSTRYIVGMPITVVGFPGIWNPLHRGTFSGWSLPKLTRGRVTGLLHDERGASCFTTDAFITDGNSGSPIFDFEGRLVGMVSSNAVVVSRDGAASKTRRTYHPNLNFCLPATLLHDTLCRCIEQDVHEAKKALLGRHIDKLVRWGEPARY